MLYVPTYTHERRPYSTTNPTSFTLDSLLALTIRAQRRTYGWSVNPALWLAGDFSCDGMLWDERAGGLTGQPMGPLVGTTTMTAVMRANRVESGSFSSRCCTFRRTRTTEDPIRLLCIRLALPLTLSLLLGFAPSARFGVSPRGL